MANNQQNNNKVGKEKMKESSYPLIPGGFDLIFESWQIFSRLWQKLFVLVFVVPLIFSLLALSLMILVGLVYLLVKIAFSAVAFSGWTLAINVIFGVLAATVFIVPVMVAFFIAFFSAIFIIDNPDLSPKEAFKKGTKYFWRYLWLIILSILVVLAGYVLLIIPGVYLAVAILFSVYILALENLGGWAALKRSRQLIRGFWWTILARLLIAWLASVFFMTLINILMRMIILVIVLPAAFVTGLGSGQMASGGAEAVQGLFLIVVMFLAGLFGFVVGLASNFIVSLMTMIYQYLIYKKIKGIKDQEPASTDRMPMGKKVGLALLLTTPLVLIALVIASVIAFIAWFESQPKQTQQPQVYDDLPISTSTASMD